MFKKRDKKPKPWEIEEEMAGMPPVDAYTPEPETQEGDVSPSGATDDIEDPGETSLITASDYDALLAKPKKKRNPRTIIILLLVVFVAGVLLVNYIMNAMKGPAPTYAEFFTAERGEINQTLSSSGSIRTGDKQTIFSPVGAPISSVNLELGSVVTAGTQIFTFDTTDLERSVRTAAANSNLTSLQAQQSRTNSAEAATTAGQYQSSMDTMQQQREIARQRAAEAQTALDALNAEVGPQIQQVQGEITTLEDQRNVVLASGAADAAEQAAALQLQIEAANSHLAELQGQLQGASTALSTAQADVEQHNGIISQLENLRDTAENGVLDANGNAQLNAQGVPAQVTLETARAQLETAQLGVTAPITGVVTSLDMQVGGMAAQYSPMCVIESLQDVDVLLSLSRYDLERVQIGQQATITTVGNTYNGTVTHIDSMATQTTTQSGTTNYVGATVSITNPDEHITLGIDANVTINTGKATDVLTIPTNAVNTDVDGSYVFVVKDGIAQRRSVETGLSSDTLIEVTSGLSEGETVIQSSQNIVDGMNVSDDPAYMSQMDMATMMM